MSYYHDENDMKLLGEMTKLTPEEFRSWRDLNSIIGRDGDEVF